MSDQVKVQSVARISSDFVRTHDFLKSTADATSAVLRGMQPAAVTRLPADITDHRRLREAFPSASIDSQMTDIMGDESIVGTVGDLQIVAKQSDAQALCIRACSSRYTSRAQRKLQAAFRLSRHAGDNGLWSQLPGRLQSALQQTKR